MRCFADTKSWAQNQYAYVLAAFATCDILASNFQIKKLKGFLKFILT